MYLATTALLLLLLIVSRADWSQSWKKTSSAIAPHYLSNKNVYMSFLVNIAKQRGISLEVFELMVHDDKDNCNMDLDPSHKILLHISDEHNVVLAGGRGVHPSVRSGRVPTRDNSSFYLVRLNYPSCVAASDIVLEYSNMNIQNLRLSGFYDSEFLNKYVYVPPMPFAYDPLKKNHSLHVMITTFGYPSPGDRRSIISSEIGNNLIDIRNVHYSSLDEYAAHLDEARILVNVHQTPHHHTLEEFRILPALLRGVIVVSEWVPLQDTIFFAEYIIFAPYNEIVKTAIHVNENYNEIWNRIYGNTSYIRRTLSLALNNSYASLDRLIVNVSLKKNITFQR